MITRVLPSYQRFRKFRSEAKWIDTFRFLPTGIFVITSGGGPLIPGGILRAKFAVLFDKPVHYPTSLQLSREFGKGIKNG